MASCARAPLGAYDPSLARLFRAAVAAQPGRMFLAGARRGGGWRRVTYEQARRTVDALAAALIERGLSAERPVMILSGNAIDHALLMLAGYTRRHPGRADFGRLFAAEPGPRQAQAHRRAARARARSTSPTPRRSPRRWRRSAWRRPKSSRAATAPISPRHVVRRTRAHAGRPRGRPGGRRDRRRHDREIPVHLGLDRPAQGRHQHPRHADGEPAADRCRSGRSSPSSR